MSISKRGAPDLLSPPIVVRDMTYLLALVGLLIGIFLLILTKNISLMDQPAIANDPTGFNFIFKITGVSFITIALISIIANYFAFTNHYKLGWFILLVIYSFGTLSSIYAFIHSLMGILIFEDFIMPYPLLFLILVGIFGLYNLIHQSTVKIFFKQTQN